MSSHIDIVFDGPPGNESGRFIEVEDDGGAGVSVGEWIERPTGLWALRIPDPRALREALRALLLARDRRASAQAARDTATAETRAAIRRQVHEATVELSRAWAVVRCLAGNEVHPAGGPEQDRGAAALRPAASGMYPPGWPKCACGDYCMDGKATCGRVECLR